ncbi:hypothetical protein QR685DRAFT_584564 [Neurospora intermedia]|uniref:Uncharacterized protein n=1 Tax=Neurospora intermedia TaxID=5142 RepID=A0ABR3DN02_NEUIN
MTSSPSADGSGKAVLERTEREFEDEEDIRPVKRPKNGGGEVYEETRERIMVAYPHVVDLMEDVDSPDTQLDDRHFSGLWDFVRVNAMKDAVEIQDNNSDDGNSNSYGSIQPAIQDTFTSTNTRDSYHSSQQALRSVLDMEGNIPRTPSPRHPPPNSPAPYISPISPPISQFSTVVPSFTLTPQGVSPTSHLGPSRGTSPGFISSGCPYTYYEEEEEEEGEEEGEVTEDDFPLTLEKEEEEEEWEGFPDEEEDNHKEEEQEADDKMKRKRKRKKIKNRRSIVFWRREAWQKEQRMKFKEKEWEGFSDKEREGDTSELEDEGSEDAHGGSSPTSPVSPSSPPAPPFHIRRFLRRNLRPRHHADQTVPERETPSYNIEALFERQHV